MHAAVFHLQRQLLLSQCMSSSGYSNPRVFTGVRGHMRALILLSSILASVSAFLTPVTRPHITTARPPSHSQSTVSLNVVVSVGEGENIDNAVKRFKREVNKSGHLQDLRFHRYHETSQERAKRKSQQARRKDRMLRLSLKRGNKS